MQRLNGSSYLVPILFLSIVAILLAPLRFGEPLYDDYIYLYVLKLNLPLTTLLRSLFQFSIDHEQINLWWLSKDITVHFFRPLTALSYWFDQQLWQDLLVGMHIQSILWYLANITAVYFVLKAIFPKQKLFYCLATFIFAFDFNHFLPTVWIANRHSSIALCLGLCSLLFLIKSQSYHRQGIFLLGSYLFFFFSLLASELGISTIALIVAYLGFISTKPKYIRIQQGAIFLILIIAWKLLSIGLGAGIQQISLYTDPIAEPLEFLKHAPKKILFFILLQFTPIATISTYHPHVIHHWLLPISLLLALSLGLIFYPLYKTNREYRFLIFGFLLSLIPPAASNNLDGRMLMFTSFFGSALIASLITLALQLKNNSITHSPLRRCLKTIIYCLLFLMKVPAHFVLWCAISLIMSSPLTIQKSLTYLDIEEKHIRYDQSLIIVNPPSPLAFSFFSAYQHYHQRHVPKYIELLMPGYTSIEVTRTSKKTFLLKPRNGFPLSLEDMYQNIPLTAKEYALFHIMYLNGSLFHHSNLSPENIFHSSKQGLYRITKVDPLGKPLELEYTLKHSLNPNHIKWLYWDWEKKNYQVFALPPVGETFVIHGPFE